MCPLEDICIFLYILVIPIKRNIVLILVTETHDQLIEEDDQVDIDKSLRKLQLIERANDDVRNISLDEIIGAPRSRCNHILMKNSIFKKNPICMVIIDDMKDVSNGRREKALKIGRENTIERYKDPIHLHYGRGNTGLLCSIQMLDGVGVAIHVIRTMDAIVIHDVSHSTSITGVKRVQIFWGRTVRECLYLPLLWMYLESL